MRKIKFRGFDKIAQSWINGGICFDADIKGRTYITTNYNEMIEVEPETVGQFTGLTDKNGKEIYEGDVLKLESYVQTGGTPWDPEGSEYHYTYTGFVKFIPSLGFHLKVEIQYDELESEFVIAAKVKTITQSRCEKIGNIHENPELLNKDQ